jgi:hypothetical protein
MPQELSLSGLQYYRLSRISREENSPASGDLGGRNVRARAAESEASALAHTTNDSEQPITC